MWAVLEDTRAQWAEHHAWQGDDFRVTLRGGQWTAEHRGCVTDAVAAQASSDLAKKWVAAYQENQMASFSSLRYTQEIATLLAVEWCRRHQYYLNLWVDHGAVPHHYTAEEVGS